MDYQVGTPDDTHGDSDRTDRKRSKITKDDIMRLFEHVVRIAATVRRVLGYLTLVSLGAAALIFAVVYSWAGQVGAGVIVVAVVTLLPALFVLRVRSRVTAIVDLSEGLDALESGAAAIVADLNDEVTMQGFEQAQRERGAIKRFLSIAKVLRGLRAALSEAVQTRVLGPLFAIANPGFVTVLALTPILVLALCFVALLFGVLWLL